MDLLAESLNKTLENPVSYALPPYISNWLYNNTVKCRIRRYEEGKARFRLGTQLSSRDDKGDRVCELCREIGWQASVLSKQEEWMNELFQNYVWDLSVLSESTRVQLSIFQSVLDG